ncbi:right-handed parallel beta-helix repeat-containing protein [Halorubraceae archaeon YAN]|nr:right-handed parallel beta-helix repeat-containing protein [Halorubraceae archaeon YAN]
MNQEKRISGLFDIFTTHSIPLLLRRPKRSTVETKQLFAIVFSILLLGSGMFPFVMVGDARAQSSSCDFVVPTHSSIQDRLTAASPGDTVCVDSGFYSGELVIDTPGVTLQSSSTQSQPVLSGSASGTAITIDGADNVTVRGFEIRGYDTAFSVESSPNATLVSNTIIENSWAVRDRDTPSHDLTITDNFIQDNSIRAISIEGSDRTQIIGNHIAENSGSASGSGYAIYIRGGSGGAGVVIEENTITAHDIGISIWTPDAVIRDNTITDHSNTAINLRTGLSGQNGHDALIEGNSLDNDGTNIAARSVRNPEIRDNTLFGSGTDIDFEFVRDAIITDNEMITGVLIDGSSRSHFDHEITGNTIGGAPLVYLNGETAPTIPSTAGQIIVYDSTDVTITELTIDSLAVGIQVAYSSDVTISNNTIAQTAGPAILLRDASGAAIEQNIVTHPLRSAGSSDAAISVSGSPGATIAHNEVSDSAGRSIAVTGSANAEIHSNTLVDNYDGAFISNSDSATVSDNVITGTHHGGGFVSSFRSAILVTGSEGIRFERNHIYDNAGNGIHDNRGQGSQNAVMRDNIITGNGNDGFYWGNSRGATFSNNTVSDNDRRGIFGPTQAMVTDNTVINNGGTGIDASHDAEVRNNDVEDNGGHGVEANARSIIQDNRINDNGGSGIFFRYYDGQVVRNNTLSGHQTDLVIFETEEVTVVDNTFETGVQLISSSNPYSTLEEDLTTHSFSGNTVAGKELYYVSGAHSPTIPNNAGQLIIINSTDVVVSDLSFDGVTAPIQIAFSDVTVTNNTISNSAGSAIQRGGTLTLWASDNAVVSGNTITASAANPIRVVESDRVELTNNTIIDSDRGGILFEGATNASIVDTLIRGTTFRGIDAERSHGASLEHVTVRDTGNDGVYFTSSDGVTVQDSTIERNSGHGLYLSGSDVTVEQNTIAANEGHGIATGTVPTITIAENTITDNDDTGISVGGTSATGVTVTKNEVHRNDIGLRVTNDAHVTNNSITGHSSSAIQISFNPDDIVITNNELSNNGVGIEYERATWSSSEPVTATNNWWGAENGPRGGVTDPVTGAIANGDGDIVDQKVRFDPWLTTSQPDDETDSSFFAVAITTTNSPVIPGADLTVSVTVTNTGAEDGTQTIYLEDISGTVVDSRSVSLSAAESVDETLTWSTDESTETEGDITVRSDNDEATQRVRLAAIGAETEIAACTVITTPGEYTLTGDLSGSQTCIQIAANDVTLDGMGHTIQGHDLVSGTQYGIHVYNPDERVTNVTVTNLTVDGWTFGVRLQDTDESTVSNVTAQHSGSGVSLLRAHANEFVNISARENRYRGILISGSTQNTFTEIAVVDNEIDSSWLTARGTVYLSGSSNNVFDQLTATRGGVGVRVLSGTGNSFTNITTTDTRFHGLEIHSHNHEFENVAVTGSGWEGIRVAEANNNQFRNVNTSYNDGSGIRLAGSTRGSPASSGNTLLNITAIGNDPSGVALSVANNNELHNLTLDSNVGISLDLSSRAQGNVIDNVTIVDGGSSAVQFGPDSVANTVRNSTVTDTNGVVLSFRASVSGENTGNIVSDMTVSNSGTAFVSSWGATSNTVTRMTYDDVTVSFRAQDVAIMGTDSINELPASVEPIGAYLDIIAGPQSPVDTYDPRVEYLQFYYEDADSSGLNEDSLRVWRLNETWNSPSAESYSSGVNTTANYVYAENITGFSTFGVFGEQLAAELEIQSASVNTTETASGSDILVSATVENVGPEAGELTVPLSINGTIADTQTVTLDPSETEVITFTHTLTDPGTYSVAIGNTEAGTVTVLEQADIILYRGSVDSVVTPDEEVTVTGDLYNRGGVSGEHTVLLNISGETVADTTVTVEPGIDRGAVSLTWTPTIEDLAGEDRIEVDVYLNDFFVKTVTVENQYSDINVIAASVSEVEVVHGEEAYVIGSIYQAGTIDGPEVIKLNATDESGNTETIGQQEVTLSPAFYHLGAINITATFDGPGTYELTLGDRSAGTIEVIEAVSDIQVIAASLSTDQTVENEEFYVIGSIYQAGTIDGPQNTTLNATPVGGGETIELGVDADRTLAPGFYHLGAINMTATIDTPGMYEIELGGRAAGTIEVIAANSDIQVIAASQSTDEVLENEEFYVVGSIYQAGNIDGPQDTILTATPIDGGESIELGVDEERTLSPGFYHLGAINMTATIDTPGMYEIELGGRAAGTIEVIEAVSDIQVIAASRSTDEALENEPFYVIGSIYQAGNIDGPQDISLTATPTDGGDPIEIAVDENRTLSPGFYHLGAINLTATIDTPGTYDIELGGRDAGTIEVIEAVSDIQVIAASASEDTIVEGESFHTIGSIYQAGTIDGPQDISLTATPTDGGSPIELGTDKDRMLSPGFYHLGAINMTATIDEPGTYEITLGDQSAGEIVVEAAVSDIQVISGSVSEMSLTVGEEFYTVGSIYQAGNIDGPQDITLTATPTDGGETIELATAEAVLSPGFYHLGALNISATIDEPGQYELTLGDRVVGTVGVDESPSDIQVIAASLSEIEKLEGEDAYVVGSIYQNGTANGGEPLSEEITLRATPTDGGETIELGSQTVSLSPGFYHLGALNISFTLDEPGIYDLTLGEHHAGTIEVIEAVSEINVIAASISETEIVEGESFNTVGSIYQAGTIDGPEDISLTATPTDGGSPIELGLDESRTLSPGFYHLGAINMTATIDTPGTYEIELGGRDAGTIEVLAAVSEINVIAASVSETELVEGESFYTIGSLYQAGTIDGPEDISLTATPTDGGDPIELAIAEDRTLAPGFYHLGAVNISATLETPGTYEIRLGGRDAGTIEVLAAVSDIQVIAASASEDTIVQGESFYTVGSIYQAGTISGPEDIALTATPTDGGEPIELGLDDGRTLSPGFYHLGAINMTATIDEPGTYDIALGGRTAGTVEVLAAASDIQVIAASPSVTTTSVGSEFYVIGSLYQAGTIDGPEDISLTATPTDDGSPIELGVQDGVTLSPGFYHLGAINMTATFDSAGSYDLSLGDRSAGTVTVEPPVVEPQITNIDGYSTEFDPDRDVEVVYTNEDTLVSVMIDSDLAIDHATVRISSLQTSYVTSVDATHQGGDYWDATIPVDSILDDGLYELTVVAADVLGTGGMKDAAQLLAIDRDQPSLSVSITDVDNNDATVTVESSEPLSETPTVDATVVVDGSEESANLVMDTSNTQGTSFTGTIYFDESGQYSVSATGVDRAGNEATDTAAVTINTDFTLGAGEIILADSGTTVTFDVKDDADEAIKSQALFLALSENTVNPHLEDGHTGVGFVSGELDGLFDTLIDDGVVEGITLSVAVDDTALPTGSAIGDVEMHYFDTETTAWSSVESTVQQVGDTTHVVADVPGFSTYGLVVPDTTPPTLTHVSPTDGDALDSALSEATVRFEYEDDLSGVNVESIDLIINGVSAGGAEDEATQISSGVTTHTLSVTAGESYTATLTIEDKAGNAAEYETNFTVESADDDDDSQPDTRPPSRPSASIDLSHIELSTSKATVGEPVNIAGTLENTGRTSGTYTATLSVDGTSIGTQTVTVPARDTVSVSFTHQFDTVGEYTLDIDGQMVTITVSEQEQTPGDGADSDDDATDTEAEPSTDDRGESETDETNTSQPVDEPGGVAGPDAVETDSVIPGFGITIVLVTIVLSALIFGRRHQ